LARWFRPDGYIFEIRVVDARGKIDAVFRKSCAPRITLAVRTRWPTTKRAINSVEFIFRPYSSSVSMYLS
jgi:hypothetical protein